MSAEIAQGSHRHLFTKLDLFLNSDLSVKETYFLIMWGKNFFFSPDLQHVRVYDPLLLTGWFERLKQKLLEVLQNFISTTLQKILCYVEELRHNEDLTNEETFIKVHTDVTQFLEKVLHNLNKIFCSLSLFLSSQCLNCAILDAKNAYLFYYRCCAAQISPNKNNNDEESSTVCMLEKLEDNASSIVQKILECLAQANLRIYFKKSNRHIDILMEEIQRQCACLPETALEIKTVIVKIAYNIVSEVYLKCLMKTKFKKLEQPWRDAKEKIEQDIQNFHKTFSKLNGSAAQQNQLLQRMTEVLHSSDVDALKIICCYLFRDFPQESKKYVAGLLCWNGVLSKRQVREVLDLIRDLNL
ncbi:Exocyst complex component 3-like protein 2 [Labeo rohita]|uniref:Exocyst complex component 3-like protein 2 n=1 Tax=Labeo rohita TaxID=84645 RepID=A0ABQ8L6I8_LABRO|nr:Exocyst complex component 3-like protein 2 [Labeo rohita]